MVHFALALLATSAHLGAQPQPVPTPPPAAALVLSRSIALPNVKGRIDHMALDPDTGRLFIAALENNSLEVVDVASGKHLRSIPGLPEPQGVGLMRRGNGATPALVVACGGDGSARIFDPETLKPSRSIALGDDADNVRCAGADVYIGCGSGAAGAIALLRPDSAPGDAPKRFPLPGHPEGFALLFAPAPDPAPEHPGHPGRVESHLIVNIPSAHEVASIDLATGQAAHWHIDAASNFPLCIAQRWDAAGEHSTDRVFIGCRRPAQILMLDPADGRVLATAPCTPDVDDLILSADDSRLYAVCGGGGGSIDAFEVAPDALRTIGTTPTAAGARTGILLEESPITIGVACPGRSGNPAALRIYTTAAAPKPEKPASP
jgi:hypothetical protein